MTVGRVGGHLPARRPVREGRGGANSRDITERKRTEEALRGSRGGGSRKSFDDAAIGMALVGTDGRFLRTNRSLCNMLGYRDVELLGKTFQHPTHPRRPRCGSRPCAEMLVGEMAHLPDGEALLHKRGPGGVGPPERLCKVHDEKGEPLWFVSQILDISERKSWQSRSQQGRGNGTPTKSEQIPAVTYIDPVDAPDTPRPPPAPR